MKKKAGNRQNLMRIIRLLRHSKPMTRQEIARELDLSMPTALANIEELLTNGILAEIGENASTGGRRAKRGIRKAVKIPIIEQEQKEPDGRNFFRPFCLECYALKGAI